MAQAKDGYRYYQVETPVIFREVMLPEDRDDFSPTQEREMKRLEKLAEAHGTHVQTSSYERG
jgi:hypothetical protein